MFIKPRLCGTIGSKVKYMKKLLKKTGKMLLLYAAFGLLTALVFTATGAGGNLVVKSALGSMSPGTYIWLMFLVAVYWLPAAVICLVSPASYLRFPFAKAGIVPVLGVFGVLRAGIIRKKS